MKKRNRTSTIAVMGLGIALSALSTSAHAFGPAKSAASAPVQNKDQNKDQNKVQNKTEFLDRVIREFNARYADVIGGEIHEPDTATAERAAQMVNDLRVSANDLCNEIAPILDQGLGCSDLITVKYSSEVRITSNGTGWNGRTPHASAVAELTAKGAQLVRSSFFYDAGNSAVDYNVRAIQAALMNLQLLPSQRKAIDGFWTAATGFSNAVEVEKAKAEKGEKAFPLTHRRFAEQANLLVSYYRYLKNDLSEFAQLGSVTAGASSVNQESVAAIERSTEHLSEAYGLDQDVAAKQIADLGRVLVDLMTNFALPLTLNEKALMVQPIMAKLVTRVVPTSEAYGDVGAHEAVLEFKALWEAESFQKFLEEKLSSSDEKSTNLILNLSALTYKLGLSANVEIRTFDARDVQRIRGAQHR